MTSLFLVAGSAAVLAGQQSGTATVDAKAALEGQLQGTVNIRPRMAVEGRVTKGAPYSAEAVTEFVQALPDGNRITRKTLTRTFRDSEGRTRREQVSNNSATGAETTTITIGDPVEGVSFVLEPETRTAFRQSHIVAMPSRVAPSGEPPAGAERGGGRGGGAGIGGPGGRGGAIARVSPTTEDRAAIEAAAASASGMKVDAPASGQQPVTENLGQQIVEGILAEGTRTTTVIPAGAIGNQQPIKVVSEQWFSPDLQVLVSTRHSDPRTGETVYRLTNIVRGEQDRSLFEVPADYTVKEPLRRQPSVR